MGIKKRIIYVDEYEKEKEFHAHRCFLFGGIIASAIEDFSELSKIPYKDRSGYEDQLLSSARVYLFDPLGLEFFLDKSGLANKLNIDYIRRKAREHKHVNVKNIMEIMLGNDYVEEHQDEMQELFLV